MTGYKNNKKLYEMYLDRLKLDYAKAIEMNEKIESMRKRQQHINLLLEDLENYINNLNFLLKVVNIEEVNFKERRLGYLNQSITEALAQIFPNEQFVARIDCNVVRGRNYAQLILYDRDGNERMPFVQEGKMCQYLISFAAVKGVTTALGSETMFIDEAFGAASSDNTQKMGPIIQNIAESGIQVILVSQNSNLYENVPHREICFHKDEATQAVVIDNITDY